MLDCRPVAPALSCEPPLYLSCCTGSGEHGVPNEIDPGHVYTDPASSGCHPSSEHDPTGWECHRAMIRPAVSAYWSGRRRAGGGGGEGGGGVTMQPARVLDTAHGSKFMPSFIML